jgi:hypothetical protein
MSLAVPFIALFLTAVSIIGCAPSITRTPIEDLAKRIEFERFSILPPQGEKWYIVSPSGPYNVAFQKQLDVTMGPKPSVAATVFSARIDGVAQAEKQSFLEALMRRTEQDAKTGRLRLIEFKSSSDESLGVSCKKYDVSSEDRGNPNCPSCIYILQVHGLACLHPSSPVLVKLEYSPRVPQGESIPSVEKEGEAFLRSLIFK